ncbi:diguanylate cyclase, partial [bacterium]|nr:diguanylate cyclase [bacterium]
ENIRQSVEALAIKHPASKVSSVVTISVGCATLYPCDKTYIKKDLLKFADEALYKAKHNGRNTIVQKTVSEIKIEGEGSNANN